MRKGRERVMMVGIIVLLMSIQLLMPSFAQDDCWSNIAKCFEEVDTIDGLKKECCKVIFEEISTEKECFCIIKPIVDSNVTTANAVSEILSLCDGLASFDTICSDSTPSPIAPQPPSTPDSAPSPIAATPGAPTPSSPAEILFPPTPGPPSPAELLFPPTLDEPATDNDTGNGSGDENDDSNAKKIGYPMVLISSSVFLILTILLS